nr:CdaR family protein [Chloroflexaceae bacterium]
MSALRATLLRIALALGLSFALWAFVSFSENPEEQLQYPSVPIETRNVPSDLVIVDRNGLPSSVTQVVSVTVETDRLTRESLRQVDVRAFVDLSGSQAGERFVPVYVEATRPNISLNFPRIDPANIPVRLERLITETAPITLTVQGNVPFSFALGAPEIQVNNAPVAQAQVRGPENRVERVVQARAVADVDGRSASYSGPLPLEAVDANGQVVEGVVLVPSTVDVRVPITPLVGLKPVPVLGRLEGFPAAGFEVASVQSNPLLINLTGSSGTLDQVARVETDPIDINGIQGTVTRTVAIRFPQGTSPQAGEPTEATVTITVVPITRPFQAQVPAGVQIVNIGSGLFASSNQAAISVQVAGTAGALNQLSTTSLVATVNVQGLGAGTYQVTPSINLPPGVSLVGNVPQVTVTLRATPTAVPTASPETPGDTATPAPP